MENVDLSGGIYMTPSELAARCGRRVPHNAIELWRSTPGAGPDFVMFGSKPFYELADVLAWEATKAG